MPRQITNEPHLLRLHLRFLFCSWRDRCSRSDSVFRGHGTARCAVLEIDKFGFISKPMRKPRNGQFARFLRI